MSHYSFVPSYCPFFQYFLPSFISVFYNILSFLVLLLFHPVCYTALLFLSIILKFYSSFISLYHFVIWSFFLSDSTFLPVILHLPLFFLLFMFSRLHYFLPLILVFLSLQSSPYLLMENKSIGFDF